MTSQPGRLSLLRNIQDAHKKDIKTYVSGHLNLNKLNKFQEKSSRETWPTSLGAPVRMKPSSQPVHLPVRRGQLTREQQQHKDMQDTVKEFSFGALGRYSAHSTSNDTTQDSASIGQYLSSASQLIRERTETDLEKPCLVEELKLPDIMFYASDNAGSQKVSSRKNKEQKTHACSRKRDFIKSHLGHVTKSDQYEAMKNFESNVMNLPDASDKGLLTGDRVVRKLRRRLKKKLRVLSESSKRGPNFHRLQAHSDCFSEVIEQSTTFSRLLKLIKDEYDSYLAYILEQNRVTRHRTLYSQIPSISKAKSVAEAVRLQQIRLENLENEVRLLLNENDRLRANTGKERELEIPIPAPSVHCSEHSGLQTRVHVEAVAKDLQEQVEDLHSEIAHELETLDEMRKYQRENCVPSSVCQHFEQCIKETEVDIQKMLKQNEFLEQSIEELEEELAMILSQHGVTEKDSKRLWKKVNLSKVLEYGRSKKQ